MFEIYLLYINNNFCHCIYHIYDIYDDDTISFILFKKSKTISQFFLLLSFLQFNFVQKLILKNHICHFIYNFSKLASIREIRSIISEKGKKEKKIYSLSLLNRINTIVKLNVNSMSVKTSEMFISGPNCRCWARIKPPWGTRFNFLKLFVFSKRKGSRMFIQTSLIPFIRPRMQAFSMVTQFSNFMKSYIYAFLHKTDKNPTWVLIFALLIFRD